MDTLTTHSATFTIDVQGAFSLRESALFGFGQRQRPAGVGGREPDFDGVLRLAFCLDGDYETPVGVEVRQAGDRVECVVHGDLADAPEQIAAVSAQVARVLSLDHDARGYDALADRDPVISNLMARAPGLRPPLFHSPYEAATWAVLSARRPGWQMDRVRSELSRAHGTVFELAGQEVACLPTPSALLAVAEFPKIDAPRLERLHAVARAARAGRLDAAGLRALDPVDAMREVQQLPGIGPFYAALLVIRALGHTDVLPTQEPRALALAGELYSLDGPATPAEFEQIAQAWRPWRTWCTVLLRAAGGREP